MELTIEILYWLGPLILWSLIWKAIALWKCGRNKQPIWYILLFVIASAGILPIIYLAFFQRQA